MSPEDVSLPVDIVKRDHPHYRTSSRPPCPLDRVDTHYPVTFWTSLPSLPNYMTESSHIHAHLACHYNLAIQQYTCIFHHSGESPKRSVNQADRRGFSSRLKEYSSHSGQLCLKNPLPNRPTHDHLQTDEPVSRQRSHRYTPCKGLVYHPSLKFCFRRLEEDQQNL
ncbi:unnamed protein product [Protopolystoma xenopodis]|uniref:Uncharacterized protein n=1 Tax=Protopolystoma xenopodis TaxID=117903 RepID=A0A3S5A510_9PLAT|nr:unnamed protein product [Protopolystoma xenopodis]